MKHLKLVTVSLALTLSLGACSKSEEPAAEATPESGSLLSHVPAGTPYLVANLRPIPDAVIDANFARFEPVAAELQTHLAETKAGLQSDNPDVTGDAFTDNLLLAVLQELDGKLNRAGLESLGWDLSSTSVVYGDGAFPVARIGLSDADVLRATVLRILENAEIDATEQQFQGVSYWKVASPDTNEMPVGFYVSILTDHVAAGLFPLASEADYLPGFLGVEMPADSDAAGFLADLNRKHGFTPYGTAHLDLHRLADEFLDPEARTAQTLMDVAEYDLADFSEQCVAETHQLIDSMPTLTLGVTELDPQALAYQVVAGMPASLASQVQELVSAIPAARAITDRIAELSFGIKVGAVRDFLRQKTQAVIDTPFQCEHYGEFNSQAKELLVKLDQPLPPFVNNFRGIRLSLKEMLMDPATSIPSDASGHLAVHVEQPEMFVGMAQMFVPDLSALSLAPGEDPVKIPDSLIQFQNMVAYAAMSEDAIGVSVGEGEQDSLLEFLDMEAARKGTVLSVDFDQSMYYEYQSRHTDAVIAHGGGANPMIALGKTMLETARQHADRNHTEVRLTGAGLVVESRYTYK
jgi:hypothetical protein